MHAGCSRFGPMLTRWGSESCGSARDVGRRRTRRGRPRLRDHRVLCRAPMPVALGERTAPVLGSSSRSRSSPSSPVTRRCSTSVLAAARRWGRGRVLALWALVVASRRGEHGVPVARHDRRRIVTPVVVVLAQSIGVTPLPFALATVWLANTASLALPVSNLTNLLARPGHRRRARGFFRAELGAHARRHPRARRDPHRHASAHGLRERMRRRVPRRPADPALFWSATGGPSRPDAVARSHPRCLDPGHGRCPRADRPVRGAATAGAGASRSSVAGARSRGVAVRAGRVRARAGALRLPHLADGDRRRSR